jgi:hypothetical protein
MVGGAGGHGGATLQVAMEVLPCMIRCDVCEVVGMERRSTVVTVVIKASTMTMRAVTLGRTVSLVQVVMVAAAMMVMQSM